MKDLLTGIHARHVGAGDPRLFIHCSLGVGDMLLPLARALPAARTIVFDLPGHGRSAPWSDSNGDYPTLTVDIAAALLEQAGDAGGHVVGHSYGAVAALRLAVERPDLVRRLTLIEPVFFALTQGTPAYAAYEKMFAPFVEAWSRGDKDAAAAAFIALWGFGVPWDAMAPAQRRGIVERIHLIPAAVSLLDEDQTGVSGKLGRLSCPVDLVEGAKTQPIIAAIHDALQACIPNVRRHFIAGGGHMCPVSHPKDVAAALAL